MPLANRDIFSIYINRLFPTRVLIVLIILMGGACLVFWLFSQWNRGEALKRMAGWVRSDFVLVLLLLLLLIRIISMRNSLNYFASLNLLLFYLSMVALYVILRFVYEREKDFLLRLLQTHLVMVSAIAVFGLLQLVLSFFGIRLPGVLVGSTFVRIPATFYDANHLPPYLLTAFPSIFIYFFYIKKEYKRALLGVLLSIFALVLLFTFSRSGFLSFSVAFLILSLVFLKRRYWQKVLTVSSVFIFALVVIFLTSQTQLSMFKRLSSVLNIEDKSTVAHGLLAYGGIELLKESPIIGLGYGSFSEHFRRSSLGKEQALVDTATDVRIPVHSIWLEVLVETGIAGFAVYLWFMITVLEKGWLSLRRLKNKKDYLLHLALLSSMVGILVSGLFYSYNLEFFWFFIFITYFQSRRGLEGLTEGILEPEAESVPWQTLFYFGLALAAASSLTLYGLAYVPILSGSEGVVAVIGRELRADWGYGIQQWWLPKYAGHAAALPPLPIWLNAFWTFLFDFGAWVPRFLPALSAVLGTLAAFMLGMSFGGLEFSYLVFLSLLGSPGFLPGVRFGSLYGFTFFFSAVSLLLIRQIIKGRRYLILPLVLLLSAFSLVSYEGYILILLTTSLFFAILGIKSERVWLTVAAALPVSAAPLVLWGVILSRVAQLNLAGNINFLNLNTLLVAYFLALPLLALGAVRIFNTKYRSVFAWAALPLILISFYNSITVKGNPDFMDLISTRMAISRDGRIPLYTLDTVLSDARYYSQVPIAKLSIDDLKEKFHSDLIFFAVVDGATLRDLRENGNFGFNALAVRNNLILIERPGKIE